ncbi:MAG: glycosyltransferase family 4 protein [Gammaproteobacteria bacterium]|nr:glycosyltransferase family 4 protein [Gammaproteobacteria bacterium]
MSTASSITVAHVNVAKGYRGGERQTELLIRELAGRGIGQRLVARRGGPLAERLGDSGVKIRLVSGNPLGVAAATGGVDVVHVHEGRSVYGAYLRALMSRTPYILTRRVDNPIGEHRLAHAAYRHAFRVVAVAPQVADVVRRFDPAVRTDVIHSSGSSLPVDPVRSAAVRERYRGKLIVGHVGALDNRQKGQEFIIEVARELEESHPDLHFLLVGGGDDEIVLKRQASGLGNVTFAGFVDNVGDYLAAFDMFVLPSRREGIGSILLDAMEHRLPIVASRVGGVPEIVHDGDNGMLIDPERPDQLKARILSLAADPELRRRLGDTGHRIAQDFTADVMCRKYLALYEAAVAARRGRVEALGR